MADGNRPQPREDLSVETLTEFHRLADMQTTGGESMRGLSERSFITPPRPDRFRFEARPGIVGGVRTAGTLHGWPILFNVVSSNRGGYHVRIQRGAPRPAPEILALYHHRYEHLIATTSNGSLRLFEEARGIRAEIDVADTTVGRDLIQLVARRDLRGMSFGIANEPTYVETTENGLKIRTYTEFTFDEISATAIPAFIETDIRVAGSTTAAPMLGYSASQPAHRLDRRRGESASAHVGRVVSQLPPAVQRQWIRDMAYAMERRRFDFTLPPVH